MISFGPESCLQFELNNNFPQEGGGPEIPKSMSFNKGGCLDYTTGNDANKPIDKEKTQEVLKYRKAY